VKKKSRSRREKPPCRQNQMENQIESSIRDLRWWLCL
jgi:hypothetical protein